MKKFCIFTALFISALTATANSPYASKVFEFRPAPGQFVNELPETDETTTAEDVVRLVEEQICGAKMPGLVSLGSWGGYVVFGFDHPVINVAGEYDFKIYGNATLTNEDRTGGSSEPGIVMVSMDENGDGLPNDTWYQLAGSAYNDPKTIRNYSITYFKPAADATEDKYIRWTDSEGTTGFLPRNSFHSQSYWPSWIEGDNMTFYGDRLPANAVDTSGDGRNFVLMKFDFGYVDNLPNNELKGFNLDWALDAEGQPVKLPRADFFKVYTAENQVCGWLGETSTEVAGAEDLHPDDEDSGVRTATMDCRLSVTGKTLTARGLAYPLHIYSYAGQLLNTFNGENVEVNLESLPTGLYIAKSGGATLRFLR